ncbi:MAG: beta-N-acetylhexosaminidase [Candidatus Binatia bacterium]|nr:beta-N-acetylhexosaminidase [Candidatus Binatia bacterium]
MPSSDFLLHLSAAMIPAVYGREHIGQLFMVGIPHPVLDHQTRSLLDDLRPGGIILLRRNYTNPDALSQLCAQLHSLDPQNPPFIALDHEGGRVHRLAPPFTHFPPARLLGQAGSVALAYQVGFAMGCELRSVGVDINFAPVLDVLTNTGNTVIGDRAFAADPQQVAQLGCALARGLREAGVIPCGKHFPGHGATLVDSHEDLPRDERPKDEIERIDLFPFRCAIAEQLEMVMTAHVLYPALDPLFPATLSPVIIGGVLRHTLGFRGVVVSDDLEMGAIARHSTITQAALAALKAGADLLLLCHHAELALAAREACVEALQRGELSSHRLTAALERLSALKHQHRIRQARHPQPPIDAFTHRQLVAEILWRAQQSS